MAERLCDKMAIFSTNVRRCWLFIARNAHYKSFGRLKRQKVMKF